MYTANNRADQLQFLRFICFLLIFFWHGNTWRFDWFLQGSAGTCAVSFFFILSGAVKAYSSYGKSVTISVSSIADNIKKKIVKIYPLYFIMMIVAISYSGIPMAIANSLVSRDELNTLFIRMASNFLLVQSWMYLDCFSFNGPSWFLSTILFLYVFELPLVAVSNFLYKKIKDYCYLLEDLQYQYQ